jgi:DUF1680 family protein
MCNNTDKRGRARHPRASALIRGSLPVLLLAHPLFAEVNLVSNRVPALAAPFDLSAVRLLDGSFKQRQATGRAWLLRVDDDRMLHNFRVTAGLPSAAKPYGGWEDPKCELRGHSLGHYLSALALLHAATGDAELKRRADYLVAELAKCQAAMPERGFGRGFLSAFPPELYDRADNAKPVWAPYYTLHKIYAGLLDAHRHVGNAEALVILRGMADWLDGRFGQLSREQQQKALGNEHGGMAESLAELYARTGEPRYLKLAEAFRHDAVYEPAARGEDRLTRLHANTQFPKFLGYQRLYELTGAAAWHDAALNFWIFVVRDRSFVIGGNSTHEFFFPVDQWEKQMQTLVGPESCNTYNMLRLTAALAQGGPTAAYGDFYERALFNHICSHQHPEHGNFVYYTSLQPGSYRGYSREESDFWCCVGTGMENPARFGEAIYSHGSDRLWVHQFIASEVRWGGVTVRQETAFPAEPATRLTIRLDRPRTFTLSIRQPGWAGAGFAVRVNGAAAPGAASASGYFDVARAWQDGDRVEVALPMALALEPLPQTPHFVALRYGPVVLAGVLGRDGLTDDHFRCQTAAKDHAQTWAETPFFQAGSPEEVMAKIEPVPGQPLAFRTKGLARPAEVTLMPFRDLHDQRYTVYWPVFPDEAAWQRYVAARDPYRDLRAQLAEGSVDYVLPGDADLERAHKQHGERSNAGVFKDRPWRDAADGGWFDYARMKVKPGHANKLVVTYWGSDGGGRVFDVIINGKVVATQTLENSKPGEFFDVVYPIPAELVAGKETVAVKFQAQPGQRAGGVFGLRVVAAP